VTILRAVATTGAVLAAVACAATPGAHAAVDGAVSPAVRGLDISAYQHTGAPIDWQRLAGQEIRFVAIKATEGTYYRNPFYASDARGAAAAGITVLPYVFASPDKAGGRATAKYAVQVAGSTASAGRSPLVVDLENDPYAKARDCYGRSVSTMKHWIAGFVTAAHKLTGRLPVIYTTAAWWQECTGGSHFGKAALWLAAFGGTAPDVPSPWSNWALWQYADNGKLPGIGRVDLDYYQPARGLFPLSQPAGHQQVKKPVKKPAKKPTEKHPATKHPAKKSAAAKPAPKKHPATKPKVKTAKKHAPTKHVPKTAPKKRPAK
jgi:GH25 family lysozyme M1 (1,4-beta-N-acetylmuramidase)